MNFFQMSIVVLALLSLCSGCRREHSESVMAGTLATPLSAEADGTRISLGEDPAVTPDGSATLSMDGFNLRLVSFAFAP